MRKVFWFSRHPMTNEQRSALGDCEVIQCDRTIKSAYEVSDLVSECDIIAVVAPINLQQQFLQIAGDKPVIVAVNDRVFIDGEKTAFRFVKWERIMKIEVIKTDFMIEDLESEMILK